ncbi:glycosyltransferase [Paucibacter sp. O1-1]|nr:glycosyltransferase [Paucibacter sp. O1-1]MDA3824775.1 glycosyltransferase [Paucibacter sp. O1-1]
MSQVQPLSICMLSDDFLPGATGVGTHLQAVAGHLSRRGHRISIITSRRPGEPEQEVWRGVQVYRVPTLKLFGFYQALPSGAEIERLLRKIRPDVVHHHYLGVMLLRALKVCKRLGLKQVYTYHMTEDHLTQPLPMRPFRRIIVRKIVSICNRVDLLISVSKNLAEQLPAKGIHTPVHFISNPVDFADPQSVEPMVREAGFVVMFAGRLNPEKNIPFLLRSFALMLKRVTDAQLLIAGAGADLDALQRQCAALGIQERVKFLGFLNHDLLARYYAACDVFVLPSWVETQGLVAMEAMWFAKPIVVARSVVSATELVDEGVNGFLVEPENDQELADRLVQLSADAGLRAALGAAGRRKSTQYEAESVVDLMESSYREVAVTAN